MRTKMTLNSQSSTRFCLPSARGVSSCQDHFKFFWNSCSSSRLCCYSKILKVTWRGKALPGLWVTVHHKMGSQGRNSRQELEALTMEECCLLACFPWLAQLPFLYNPRPPAQISTTHSGPGPSTPPLIKNMPHSYAHKPV